MQKIEDICSKIKEAVSKLSPSVNPVIIAIDGNCASGKSTVAHMLSKELSADIVHMDDFYLPFELRTEAKMAMPGGNIDFDRLSSEVLIPLSQGEVYTYRPYICKENRYADSVCFTPKAITIVEGSYSCHPLLQKFYDFKIFLTVEKDIQLRRIIERNGEEKALEFKDKWIPREECYFNEFDIKSICDIIF